jgi:hypothetical protein
MQASKSTVPSSLEEANFNCKYYKHVTLNKKRLHLSPQTTNPHSMAPQITKKCQKYPICRNIPIIPFFIFKFF